MVNRLYFILNTILFFCGLFSTVCYDQFGGLWLKGVTSGWFVLIGIVNIVFFCKTSAAGANNDAGVINNSGKRAENTADNDRSAANPAGSESKDTKAHSPAAGFPAMMMVGLSLCWIADIVLNITFIPGALIFAIGHVFYFIAYSRLIKFEKNDLIPSVIIFVCAASLVLFVPIFDFGIPLMQYIILGYALIISLMVGKAISNMRRENTSLTKLIVFGSILFFFSDLMLLLCYFAGAPQITDSLCLFTYYPGQYLLAHSIYRYTIHKIG